MKIFVSLDVAYDLHWACAIAALRADDLTVALDRPDGIAILVCAMVTEAGFHLVHMPGRSADRARQGMWGAASASHTRAMPPRLTSWHAPGPACPFSMQSARSMSTSVF